MVVRILLDAVAVLASALALMFASLQIEKQQMPSSVFWFALALLVFVVGAETYDLIQVMG
jgi:hypothetical protein